MFGARSVQVYEERKMVSSRTGSLTFGNFDDNPIVDDDPPGTLYLFGMGVCFVSSLRLFSTNRRVLSTDIGYDYYKKQAFKGIKNVSYILFKEDSGNIVRASESKCLQEAYDPSVVEHLKNNKFEDDDWEKEFSLNSWRERELKRCSVEWKWEKEEEEKWMEVIRKVVVEEEGYMGGKKEEKEEEKKEEKVVKVKNVKNVINVNKRIFIKSVKEKMPSRRAFHHLLAVVIVILLACLGFSIFDICQ